MTHHKVQNSWRVCINYRRLNQEIRKDHFPCLLLIRCLSAWQVSPTIAFLMVFLVTFKSILHLRTKRKPHSPAPLTLLPIEGCLLAYAMPLAMADLYWSRGGPWPPLNFLILFILLLYIYIYIYIYI